MARKKDAHVSNRRRSSSYVEDCEDGGRSEVDTMAWAFGPTAPERKFAITSEEGPMSLRSVSKKEILLPLLTMFVLIGCGRGNVVNPVEPPPVQGGDVTFTFINEHVIKPSCVGCHSGAFPKAGIDLSSYENVMNAVDVGVKIVIPGKPEDSVFFTDIESGEMPKKKPKLSPDLIEAVRQWVANGAKND